MSSFISVFFWQLILRLTKLTSENEAKRQINWTLSGHKTKAMANPILYALITSFNVHKMFYNQMLFNSWGKF